MSSHRNLTAAAVSLAACLLSSGLGPAAAQAAGPSGRGTDRSACIVCHGQFDGAVGDPVRAWLLDVHGEAGLGCEDCHGGDPSPALSEDFAASMDPEKGYRPPPTRLEVAVACARCHSDAAYMKRFDPQARVDQLAEYRTSAHGVRNAAGDPVPATCTDCHGAHGIRPVKAPDAQVYPTNVPQMCARCHSDAAMMEPYGLPVGQLSRYMRSVHATALIERGDRAAPACNDCHGNHGAAPPGVESVAFVCGHCHGREAALFRGSWKKEIFEMMEVAECTSCHEHHLTRHPTPELFSSASAPTVTHGEVTGTDPFSADLGHLEPGRAVTATWRVVLSPFATEGDDRLRHGIDVSVGPDGVFALDATVRPGAASLPDRSGGSEDPPLRATLWIESISGYPVRAGDALLVRLELEATGGAPVGPVTVSDRPGTAVTPVEGSACLVCHEPGDACDQATERMYDALVALDGRLRRAEAVLHEAEVAGMEVSAPKFELRRTGVTAAIEARALIHAYDPDGLVAKTEEGETVATAALEAGEAALRELQVRRKGLAVSLVLIALVLVALWLKIRQIERGRAVGLLQAEDRP